MTFNTILSMEIKGMRTRTRWQNPNEPYVDLDTKLETNWDPPPLDGHESDPNKNR